MPLYKHKITGIVDTYPESIAKHPDLSKVLELVEEYEKVDVSDLDTGQVDTETEETKNKKGASK